MRAGQPIARPYLDSLDRFVNAAAIRADLAARHPVFAAGLPPNVVIVGAAAPEGARLIELCRKQDVRVLAVCDGDPGKHGTTFASHVVRPVADALTWGPEAPIIIASHRPLTAVKELRALGARAVAPFALLQVLFPQVFPPHMFYAGWVEDLFGNSARYRALADVLGGDEQSSRTLEAIVGFRLTLDVTLLDGILDFDAFFSRDLVRFRHDGTFIDGGAFDGDSVRTYMAAASGKVGRIIAFEPDPATFARLKANFAQDSRVEPMNVGLHRRKAVMRFHNAGSRAALLSDAGGIDMPVIGIDEVLRGAPVSYIKLNIEGAELSALEGARDSIARHRPTLAISAYHAPDHLWRVPELIHSIEPRYRVHLRQQDGGATETVVYATAEEPRTHPIEQHDV